MDDTLNTLSFSLVPRLLCICTHKILIQAGALADASTFRVKESEFVCVNYSWDTNGDLPWWAATARSSQEPGNEDN